MGTLYELVDLDTNTKRELIGAERSYYYEPEIGFAPVLNTICYCHHCSDFTPSEIISKTEIKSVASDNNINNEDRFSLLMRNYGKMLSNRVSGPRCLVCGCDDIQIIDLNSPTSINRIEKRVMLEMRGIAAMQYNYRFFSPEGIFIKNQDSTALRKALFSK